MEDPPAPNPVGQKPAISSTGTKKMKMPSPQELISHYESKGLESQEASIKVIEDLQTALYRVISSGRGRKDKLLANASRKIDATNNRLAILDMKVDSKPGYAQTFAIGVASGLTLKGMGAVFPHVLSGIAHIWNAATTLTKQSP